MKESYNIFKELEKFNIQGAEGTEFFDSINLPGDTGKLIKLVLRNMRLAEVLISNRRLPIGDN